MRFITNKTGSGKIRRVRRNIAWMAVAALVWSSGQGAALSAVFQLAGLDTANANAWHCRMLGGGGDAPMAAGHAMPDGMAMAAGAPMDPGAPLDSDAGFCPVCSLTGCGAPSVIAQAEFHYLPPVQRYLDAIRPSATGPRLAAAYDRPRARAPPLSV